MAAKKKIPGRPVYSVQGVEIYVQVLPAKRRGKDRIWIHVRQSGETKSWRMDRSLAYVFGADIGLTRVSTPNQP